MLYALYQEFKNHLKIYNKLYTNQTASEFVMKKKSKISSFRVTEVS